MSYTTFITVLCLISVLDILHFISKYIYIQAVITYQVMKQIKSCFEAKLTIIVFIFRLQRRDILTSLKTLEIYRN